MDDDTYPGGLTHDEWSAAFDRIHENLGMEIPQR